jgi:predicted RNA-binding Zn-ribbon protein involved in translation (DUF1610 family)
MDPPSTDHAFSFACPLCGSMLEAPAAQAGQSGRCPSCDGFVPIPLLDPATGLRRSAAAAAAAPETPGSSTPVVHAYAAAGNRAPAIVRSEDNSYHIVCPRCMRREDIQAQACAHCGQPFTIEGVTHVGQLHVEPLVVVSFLLGMIGMGTAWCAPLAGAVVTAVALVLAAWVLWRPGADLAVRSRRLATGSLVLALAGLAVALARLLL